MKKHGVNFATIKWRASKGAEYLLRAVRLKNNNPVFDNTLNLGGIRKINPFLYIADRIALFYDIAVGVINKAYFHMDRFPRRNFYRRIAPVSSGKNKSKKQKLSTRKTMQTILNFS